MDLADRWPSPSAARLRPCLRTSSSLHWHSISPVASSGGDALACQGALKVLTRVTGAAHIGVVGRLPVGDAATEGTIERAQYEEPVVYRTDDQPTTLPA